MKQYNKKEIKDLVSVFKDRIFCLEYLKDSGQLDGGIEYFFGFSNVRFVDYFVTFDSYSITENKSINIHFTPECLKAIQDSGIYYLGAQWKLYLI